MTHKSIKRRSNKRQTRHKYIKKSRRLNRYRKQYKMRGGADETSSVSINTPTTAPPPASSSSNAANVNANSSSQNSQNQALAGGSKRRRKHKSRKRSSRSRKRSSRKHKKMRGGMGGVTMCPGAIINSADGYGYLPPVGCIQVPVLANNDAQTLAINSVHVSATGQANAEYDQGFPD